MVTTPLASLVDLRTRLGGAEVDDPVLVAALDDVSALARYEAGADSGSAAETWDMNAVPSTVPMSIRTIVLDAARRRVLNPDAYSAERVGDYSYQRASGTDGEGVFTAYELSRLRSYKARTGLGSIRLVRDGLAEAAVPSYFVGTNMEGDPMPWSGIEHS